MDHKTENNLFLLQYLVFEIGFTHTSLFCFHFDLLLPLTSPALVC
jgi:hypothetical protein